MPIQIYLCTRHGEFEVSVPFSQDVPQEADCPTKDNGRACCGISRHVLKAPAGITIKRTWNEKANEYRRNPRTQAEAQLDNSYHEQKDMGKEVRKPTEKDIQKATKKIEKQARPTRVRRPHHQPESETRKG